MLRCPIGHARDGAMVAGEGRDKVYLVMSIIPKMDWGERRVNGQIYVTYFGIGYGNGLSSLRQFLRF